MPVTIQAGSNGRQSHLKFHDTPITIDVLEQRQKMRDGDKPTITEIKRHADQSRRNRTGGSRHGNAQSGMALLPSILDDGWQWPGQLRLQLSAMVMAATDTASVSADVGGVNDATGLAANDSNSNKTKTTAWTIAAASGALRPTTADPGMAIHSCAASNGTSTTTGKHYRRMGNLTSTPTANIPTRRMRWVRC